MTIKAILFDLDNTLIDFVRMKRLSCEAAIEAMINAGLKISKEQGMKLLFDLYDKKGWEYQKIFQVFLKYLTGKVDYRIMVPGVIAYKKVKEGLLIPYPGVIQTLQELRKKYKLGILSDAPKIQVWVRLFSMGIQDHFDIILSFDDTKVKKLHSDKPFLIAAKKLNLKPEEIVMIGDSIKIDLNRAKKLKMKTVFAKYGEFKKERGKPDHVINDITELLKIL